MENKTAPPATDNPTTPEAAPVEAPAPESTEPLQTMSEKSATHHGDEYDQKLERLIQRAEQEKQQAAETPEQTEERHQKSLLEGESWDSVFDSQTPEAQRAMQSLRADYTRKTQEVANMRKELEAQKQSLLESDIMKDLKATADGEVDFDPFNPDSFKAYVEKEVAARLAAVLEPMKAEQEKHQAAQKVSSFMQQHPELNTNSELKTEVKELLLSNDSLDLESAYWIAKGKRSQAEQMISAEEKKRRSDAAKRSAALISSGARRNAGTVAPNMKEMKAWEIYQHLKGSKVR